MVPHLCLARPHLLLRHRVRQALHERHRTGQTRPPRESPPLRPRLRPEKRRDPQDQSLSLIQIDRRRPQQHRPGNPRLEPRRSPQASRQRVGPIPLAHRDRRHRRAERRVLHLDVPPVHPSQQHSRRRREPLLFDLLVLGHLPRSASPLHHPRSRESGLLRAVRPRPLRPAGLPAHLGSLGRRQLLHDRQPLRAGDRGRLPEGLPQLRRGEGLRSREALPHRGPHQLRLDRPRQVRLPAL